MANHSFIPAKQQAKALYVARRDAAFQQFLCKAFGVRMAVTA